MKAIRDGGVRYVVFLSNVGAELPEGTGPVDIADVAGHALEARNWTGVVVRELLGPRDLSRAGATRILGARIGKPQLQYVQFPYADFVAALVQTGLSANVATPYAEMHGSINDGRYGSLEGRRPENTTPTRFEDFVEPLAGAYDTA